MTAQFLGVTQLPGRAGVSAPLNEEVERFALIVDGALEIDVLAANSADHFIQTPARRWLVLRAPAHSAMAREGRGRLLEPKPRIETSCAMIGLLDVKGH